MAALRDDDQDVASKAAFGLAALGKSGTPRLLDSLQDHDSRVRGWAVTALTAAAVDGTFEGDRAIVSLQPLLHDPDVDVQRAAVQALRLLGGWTSMPTPLVFLDVITNEMAVAIEKKYRFSVVPHASLSMYAINAFPPRYSWSPMMFSS